MLGVAALITVLSVMNGFGGELRQRLLTVTPDIILEPTDPTDDALAELLAAASMPSAVTAATPFHQGTVLLRHRDQGRGVQLTGAPEAGLRDVIELDAHLTSGDLRALEQPFSVILGADLARLVRVRPGDTVDALLPRADRKSVGRISQVEGAHGGGHLCCGCAPRCAGGLCRV